MKTSFPLFLLLILSLTVFSITLVHANPSLNLTVKTDKEQYDPNNIVQVSGNLTLNGVPTTDGLVGIEVQTSSGPLVVRTLPAVHPPSETPYIFTEYVAPCQADGTPTFSFTRGALAHFKVSIANLNHFESYQVFVTVNVYDNSDTPLGVAEFNEVLLPDSTSLIIQSFYIPSDAVLGTATVYGNAYSNWPSLGGTPYVREVNATFAIVESTLGFGQSTQNQSTKLQSTGTSNYGTTFKLATMATPNTYYVYATSSYQGQSAFNSTTFFIGHGPPHEMGDLGGGYPPQFFRFDGKVTSADVPLFIQCYRGTAPPDAMYLGDLGSSISSPPFYQFFKYDGKVDSADVQLFILCYRGKGPTGPVAIFTWSPLNPIINQPITFNASQSYDDKYGTITSYAWDFGDGNTTTVSNPIVLHAFTSPGNFTVTLRVADNNTLTGYSSHIISISL
jgi:PKD repeat protein